ncbi:MAG: hypothetical protein K9J13_05745 [Saprospiraceae bacterium]|nr:hypothetical protein [Saprospiraceae bacterium]
MRILILTLLMSGIVFGCKTKNEQKEDTSRQVESYLTPDKIEASSAHVSESVILDTTNLIKNLNEFIPTITKLPHSFTCKLESLEYDSTHFSYYYNLFTDSTILISYTFECGDYFKNIKVIEALYTDFQNSQRVFSELKDISNTGHFCLTKANDYLVSFEDRIYWLNGSCYYPYYNFQRIEKIFLNSLTSNSINDSIKCKCGGQNMTNK